MSAAPAESRAKDQVTLALTFFDAFFSACVAGKSVFHGERRWVAVVLRWAADVCFLKTPEYRRPVGSGSESGFLIRLRQKLAVAGWDR